jgi:Xaa-Pro aminopeptidase
MRVVRHPHFPGFLQFDILTLCPYERKLMDLRLLTPEEIQWMDAYHARVKRTLLSIMKEDDLSIQTSLSRFTAPLVA